MKKALLIFVVVAMVAVSAMAMVACNGNDKIIVQTNAYFAPFEYFEGTNIVGVDVEIMQKVGEKLGKEVEFVNNEEFSQIIPLVQEGKVCDAGAAGLTITEERKAKVDFSIPYYTSVQYVVYKEGDFETQKATNGVDCIMWSDLAGKKIGVQLDTTGMIYTDIEINGDGDYVGELAGTGAECVPFSNAQLAAEAIGLQIDCVVVDELPAKYLTKNGKYKCAALYYDADTATEEQYAVAVTKGNTELLNAINEVLTEMLNTKDGNGKDQIQLLVEKHLGLN
ncbi:MAG: transporter substrate-binding domain-containing protein [Eubacteriales bacterium]|nr:transporter substrate-binding domain-containing protein [Eubacteriales bacterium]